MSADPTLRYFEEEMRYLKEAGLEFARVYPDRAALLNLDRVGTRDPYVERLFEGFAFLTGRIQQKLEDDLPELTESLVNMLWPHYLRMIPSLTILEIQPDGNALQSNQRIEKGLLVQSEKVSLNDRQSRCIYRTTSDVEIMPLKLTGTMLDYDSVGRSIIRLKFHIEKQAQRASLDLSNLRLFISADEPVAFALRHSLLHDSVAIQVNAGNGIVNTTKIWLEAVGFSHHDRLWDKANNSFDGYQLLLEYFCFKQKFFFIDLKGLNIQYLPEDIDDFEVDITLNRNYPIDLKFGFDALKLYCTPAINLFDMEAEPVRVDHRTYEYPVKPLLHDGMQVEIYSVEEVEAFNHDNGQRYRYVPFSSFQHRGGLMKHEAPERYFHTKVKKGVTGRHETWLMLGGIYWDKQQVLPLETLSLKVVGTNGMLPRKTLRETQICDYNTGEPNVTVVRNLSTPTLSCYPPTEDRFQWRILSHLAPNYLSLLNKDSLKGALAIYDWTEDELNKRKLNGIMDVSHQPIQRVEKGAVHRGVHITVTLDSDAYAGEAEICLFGELLNHFFGMYADLNLFTRLSIISLPSGKRYTWKDSKSTVVPF
ncbi:MULTISPECIES: type VI secretion system baseplate subunit TssF [unclassified Neisseria]|uniref:type VI secretion system baseplate subunit TssF n=1 Tax=unclassified Neisseria TaxID=2623750 RepID=UPI002666FA0A|nr:MULTISPECIES: type VI secretion system baseplate subunit TssF [unclassified Neisseria]MDO1509201.1 type VI secretion system baseplate subunit TssF [Neisseria sp. MVDL19-042950]MDO1515520.1 type VI secretion system baseplate subunit TssF [Neisseria sp. MVDL18-041461]MDO1562879.1 type VI secretion system baseplate subunit TssF [Neisseria sp. MVDL20-010259]